MKEEIETSPLGDPTTLAIPGLGSRMKARGIVTRMTPVNQNPKPVQEAVNA